MKKIIILCLLLLFPSVSNATYYWIASGGTAANLADCDSATATPPTSAAPVGAEELALYCSYDKANGSLVAAGDTVYYRGGTYSGITGTVIAPYNTGTNLTTGRIVFSSYNNETVTFVGGATNCKGIIVTGSKDYIKFHGLTFNDFDYWAVTGGNTGQDSENQCNYLEFSYINFDGMYTLNPSSIPSGWGGFYIKHSQYNWIHHCTGSFYGTVQGGQDNGAVFSAGRIEFDDLNGANATSHHVIENNTFKWGMHEVYHVGGLYSIHRNNNIINTPAWTYSGETVYAGRSVYVASTYTAGDDRIHLWENNKHAYTANTPEALDGYPSCSEGVGSAGFKSGQYYSIVRYSTIYNTNLSAFLITGTSQRYYNNTVWNNAYYTYVPSAPHCGASIALKSAVAVDSGLVDAVFKNNLFRDNNNASGYTFYRSNGSGQPTTEITNWSTISTDNWLDNNASNPLLTDADKNETRDLDNPLTQYNFTLQSTSPCRDTGKYLTTASYRDADEINVEDARYFFDGWGFSSSNWTQLGSEGPNVQPDYVCLSTSSSSVDYSKCFQIASGGADWTNDILQFSSSHGLPNDSTTYYVWLYKRSDGTQVLYGSAPDYGAYEYGDTAPSAQGCVISGGTFK